MIKLETLGANVNKVTLNDVTILFSYNTAVAFTMPLMNWIVDPTKYSRTTSRHLNSVIEKTWRIPALDREAFEIALDKALEGYGTRDIQFFAASGENSLAPKNLEIRDEDNHAGQGWTFESKGAKLLQAVTRKERNDNA